ncbi:DNA-binding transcriptional regulator GbsR (MarR family) [Methanococcus voltae]|uniref:GbsR/MarR family transcriptional regulator n=1 Tax=Methanococcus voltae TaxID=2188 RepID=UPI001AE9D469|nr:transcriptional regulator [Methanococcus voltae]MBP2143239.1 DNA-binding transcriptional regulator GbsR (MarR family) [Methanococcus voltae]
MHCDNEKEEVKKTIMELFNEIARLTNLPKSMGEVYSAIYLSEKPLCMDDIIQTLKISKGNASTMIRRLEEIKAIKKVWVEGDRKNYYKISGVIPLMDLVFKRHEAVSNAYYKLNSLMDKDIDLETKEFTEKKLYGVIILKEISEKVMETLREYENIDYEELHKKLIENSKKKKEEIVK